jgi:hypothetical protein
MSKIIKIINDVINNDVIVLIFIKFTEDTLRFKNLIMEKIRENVRKYQNSSIRRPIKLKDIKKLRLDQKDKEDRLKQFVQSFDHPDSE